MIKIFKRAGQGRYHELVYLAKEHDAVLVCPNKTIFDDLVFIAREGNIRIDEPVIVNKVEDMKNLPQKSLIITDVKKCPKEILENPNIIAISMQLPANGGN